jgi:hypothetical protein
MTPRVALVMCMVALAALPSCARVAELRGDQVTITSPRELESVALPFTVEWDVHAVPHEAAGYGVFVDRLPMKPGQDVRALFDESCRRLPACPDEQQLHTIGVYLTADTKVVIPSLVTLGGVGSRTDRPAHELTVVLVDHTGRRIGGYAASATFRFER